MPFLSPCRRRSHRHVLLFAAAWFFATGSLAPALGAQRVGAKQPPARNPATSPAAAKAAADTLMKPAAANGAVGAPRAATALDPASAAAATTPVGAIVGTVYDSLHAMPLAGARVLIIGTQRGTQTDADGAFRIDSVPPGNYRVRIEHVLLDSLGLQMVTNEFQLADQELKSVTLAIPTGESLVALSCPPGRRALGPSAIIGRILDADTDVPVDSARVSFAWSELSLQAMRTVPRLREVASGSDGVFRICGLPSQFEGTLQAVKNGVHTSEVRVTIDNQALAVQGLKIGNPQTVTKTETDTATKREQPVGARAQAAVAPKVTLLSGNAVVNGRVLNASGAPVARARVDVTGTAAATLTGESGEFTLSGLPSGTQSLVVRQLGYAPVETAIELSARTPARVTVKITKPAQVLDPVVVTAAAEAGLDDVGFTKRKKMSGGGGTFIGADAVMQRGAYMLTDVFRSVPGLRVAPGQGGENEVVQTRNGSGTGCVNYWVDGVQWASFYPGDVDRMMPPQEIAAIEVYPSGMNSPVEFQMPGQSECAAVVIWSKTKTAKLNRKKN